MLSKCILIAVLIVLNHLSHFYCFKRTTLYPILLVVLDGFESPQLNQYLAQHPKCSLNTIIKTGVKAKYVKPTAARLRFSNLMTIATGLTTSLHGIISDSIYDMTYQDQVHSNYTSLSESEPVYLTAKQLGLTVASFHWPCGHKIDKILKIWKTYDPNKPKQIQLGEILDWMNDLKIDITILSLNEPEQTIRKTCNTSIEYLKKLNEIDSFIGYLMNKIDWLNLTDKLDFIVTSNINYTNQIINLSEYINTSYINWMISVVNKSSLTIYPIIGHEKQVHDRLRHIPNVEVFILNEIEDYSDKDRNKPIIIMPDKGFTVTISEKKYRPNITNQSETIFLARGPSFKQNILIEPFESINIYLLICKLTNTNCYKRNGSVSVFNSGLTEPFLFIQKTNSANTSQAFSLFLYTTVILSFIKCFFK